MKNYFKTKFTVSNDPLQMLVNWCNSAPSFSQKIIWRGLTIYIKTTSYVPHRPVVPSVATLSIEVNNELCFFKKYLSLKCKKNTSNEYSIQSGSYLLSFLLSSEMLLVKEVIRNSSSHEIKKNLNTIVLVEPIVVEKIPALKVQDPDDVILFEYAKMPIYMNSRAYFEKENLIIDYWKLANDYEDEVFLTIKEPYLIKLYQEFDIKDKNKRALLNELLLEYEGDEDCFKKIIQFLEDKHIVYNKSKNYH
jgi:hypothetical protein